MRNNRKKTKGKVAVIGAGLGGLAAALRLAAQGWSVCVCEQAATPGGKMNTWESGGYRFDTGPSLITMPWVFEALFEAAGTRMSDHLTFQSVHPFAEYHFDDGTHFTHTGDLPAWLTTVRALEQNDASGFLRFMELGARLFNVSQATFFSRSPFERPNCQIIRALRHLPLRFGWGNYDRTVRHFFRSPHLRQLFNRYITYVGSSPYQAPATLSVIPYVEYAFGVRHIQGGLYRMIEVLCALGEKEGVEYRMNTPIRSIMRRGGRVIGVEPEKGPLIEADVVIMNGDASCAPVLLGESGAQPLPERNRSMSGLIFLYALKRTLPDLSHHQIFFSADYPTEFRQLFDERRFPDDPTVYINIPSRTDRSLVPGEGEVLFVMANAPANDGDTWDDAMIKQARTHVMQRLRKSGFPDIEQDISASTVWTPRKMAMQYGMPGGAIYGQASHSWRGAFMRPPNKDRSVAGLYYVGGSTHPGGGTPTVVMSADITSRLVEQYESS